MAAAILGGCGGNSGVETMTHLWGHNRIGTFIGWRWPDHTVLFYGLF